MRKYTDINYKLVSFILFFFIWFIIARLVNNPLLFPNIFEILKALKNILLREEFFYIIWHTLSRTFIAIVFSTIIGIILSFFSYKYRFVKAILTPFILFLKAVPTIAVIILVLIWSSVELVPIIVGILILLPVLYENILGGILSIDSNLLKMSSVFKVEKKQILFNIYIPAVYFYIAPNLPSLIGLTFKVVIAGEVLSQENLSIGGEIFLNKIYLESPNIFAWIFIIITLNFFIEKLLKVFNKKTTIWREDEN